MESAAAPPPQPQRRLSVGGVISEALSLYGAHAAVLVGMAIAIYLVAGLIQGLLNEADAWILQILASIVGMIATTLYTGFVVTLVADVRDGKRDFTVGELLGNASHAVVPLILNGIMYGIAVAIGFVLLIVPGLILITIWAVVAPAIVIERRGPVQAFGRSRELVRGDGWTVFGAIVVAFLIIIGFGILAVLIGAAIAQVAGAIILTVIVSAVTAPFAALIASVLFFELRDGRGGGEPPVAAASAA